MTVLRVIVTSLALVFCLLLLLLAANHLLFYRATVVKIPIQFRPGFSVSREFWVDIPRTYWVAIQYNRIFRSSVETPTPVDEFTAEYEVRSKDMVIAKGSTASLPDWSGPWANTGKGLIRYLGSFEAKPHLMYSVLLQITSAQPRLISNDAVAVVAIDSGIDEFRQLRESLLTGIGAVLSGALLFVYVPVVLRRLRRESRNRPV